MKKKIISLILVLATLFSFTAVYASAASGEEYISEVALVYEDTVEEAKAAIAGTEWRLFEKDLNPDADYMIDDGVYLIYKTSTDVEDAITDLRVMDMYGGYQSANYEAQLEETRSQYMALLGNIRTAANEFKNLYNAGDGMAQLAYRQMNYYKDVRTEGGNETDMLMGDFFLNMPSDENIVQVMMQGNSYAFSNLIMLLAMGVSASGDKTLATRISEMYAVKDTLSAEDYYDQSLKLSETFKELKGVVLRYDALKEEYDLEDEEISEEEAEFLVDYAITATALSKITYGEGTLKDFIAAGTWELADLYPIVAAFTKGQRALVDMGCFTIVLQCSAPSKPIDELFAELEEAEAEIKDENGNIQVFDVYMGVDRSIFEGDFAFTTEADRQQALTGFEWTQDFVSSNLSQYVPVKPLLITFITGMSLVALKVVSIKFALHVLVPIMNARIFILGKLANILSGVILKVFGVGSSGFGVFTLALGIGMMTVAVGTILFMEAYGYYNPDYTPIPNTMIDVRETDLGDKYIKYDAAKVFGDEEGRNADFNAYQGKEWNALYYTKDATAGKCLTPKFVYSETSSTIARRHQGISMFGETEAFNLNSHVFNGDAPGVYVTIRYSTAKKAAADVPKVVGSMFASGAFYTLTALGGVGVGIGGTLAVLACKNKKEKQGEEATEDRDNAT